MSQTPGQAYAYGTTYQPFERDLELTVEHLFELDAALEALGPTAQQEVHDAFIIYPP